MKVTLPLAAFTALFLTLFFSCAKINEATDLGDDLIPAVDNVNTFDTTLEINAAYHPFFDSSRNFGTETMALGRLTDPVFGTTNADMYFNLSSPVYRSSPFLDTLVAIDSVVLSLSYQAGYGDTTQAGQIGVQVFEISPSSTFDDTIAYKFNQPAFGTAGLLGSKTFTVRELKDSFRVGLGTDTASVINTLRIKLDNSLGDKLRLFDTSVNGGYYSDSLFRRQFRGLAVKTTSSPSTYGTLAYFNLASTTNSGLIVYYRRRNAGVVTASTATFKHSVAYTSAGRPVNIGVANSIIRNPSGDYLANLNNPNANNFFLQSSPTGSYIGINIPGLSSLSNRVIHRAELIAYKVASSSPVSDGFLTVPNRLMLDRKPPTGITDSAYTFENDLEIGSDGSLNFDAFGGILRNDNSYRFNLTRYVQGIVTRKERNDSLRLYAPLRSNLFAKNIGQFISIPNLDYIAKGRVVLASPSLTNGSTRMRLRIIYSNL